MNAFGLESISDQISRDGYFVKCIVNTSAASHKARSADSMEAVVEAGRSAARPRLTVRGNAKPRSGGTGGKRVCPASTLRPQPTTAAATRLPGLTWLPVTSPSGFDHGFMVVPLRASRIGVHYIFIRSSAVRFPELPFRSTTGFASSPTPGTSQPTTSPSASTTAPGVPVLITSPGSSVMICE